MTKPATPPARPRSPAPVDASTADERVTAILEQFRSAGGRVTSARRAIVRILVERPGRHSGEDIAALVQASLPEVHLSSVYRNLAELEQMGVVRHVHFGHGASMYHLADDDQIHLVCEQCGKVVDLPAAEIEPVLATIEQRYGFVLDLDHFALSGVCATHRHRTRAHPPKK